MASKGLWKTCEEGGSEGEETSRREGDDAGREQPGNSGLAAPSVSDGAEMEAETIEAS